MNWKSGLRGIVLVGGTGGVIACQMLAGLEKPKAVETPIDGGPEAAPVDTRPANACDESTLGPLVGAAPLNTVDPIDLAVSYIRSDLGRTPDAGVELCEATGFDLDHKTTCIEDGVKQPTITNECAADAACSWNSSCINKKTPLPCDEPGGVDNALGGLLRPESLALVPGADLSVFDANAFLRNGQGNLLIRLVGYNGLADDDSVQASLFVSSGIASVDQPIVSPSQVLVGSEPVDAGTDAIAGGEDPTNERWDGRALREWYLDPGGLSSVPLRTASVVAQGYVKNHVLVLPDTQLPLPVFQGVVLRFTNARIVGELRRHGETWEIVRGRMAGLISIADTVRAIASIPFSTAGNKHQTACTQPLLLAALLERTCKAADLPVPDAGDQNCGMLSFGAGFLAVPAVISKTVWRPPGELYVCDIGGFESCN